MSFFIGKLLTQDGENQYEYLIKTEAGSIEQATEYFKKYEDEDFETITQLRSVFEVKTFEDLWGLI